MPTAKSIFEEIFDNDEAFQLFCSIAASDEAQGGWENSRIAALVPGAQRDLAPKIVRHGSDEDKHGRIFNALLRKRGLEPVPVPAEADYTCGWRRPASAWRTPGRGARNGSPRPTSSPTWPTAGSPSSAPGADAGAESLTTGRGHRPIPGVFAQRVHLLRGALLGDPAVR